MKTHKKRLSIDNCKDLIYYGETRDKSIELKTSKGDLAWCFNVMFDNLATDTFFDAEKAEALFWVRVKALANEYYREDEK